MEGTLNMLITLLLLLLCHNNISWIPRKVLLKILIQFYKICVKIYMFSGYAICDTYLKVETAKEPFEIK